MMKKYSHGTLELVASSMETSSIPKEDRDKAVLDFFVMKDEADKNGDLFVAFPDFFNHIFSYGQFYNGLVFKSWGDFHNTPSLSDISSKTYEYINAFQSKVYSIRTVKTVHELEDMPNPQAKAGFVKGVNSENVHSVNSWTEWHQKYDASLPLEIDWRKAKNEIMPNSEITECILCDYIEKNDKNDCFSKPEYQDISSPANPKLKCNASALIVHSEILAKKSNEERAGEGLKLFRKICEQNGYCHEQELSQLEHNAHRNARRCIYSIINKRGKHQFLSFDYRHAMMELCNENGKHQGEYHFDGTLNSKEAEEDHSLTCIEAWRKLKKQIDIH